MSTTDHAELTRELFLEGYNCSQAVFAAFCDLTGISKKDALTLSQGLGGGIGRMRGTCGAVTGIALVISALYGSDDSSPEAKGALYARVREVAAAFKERAGSDMCFELLNIEKPTVFAPPEKRTPEFYASRPCLKLLCLASTLIDEYIKANPV